MDNPESHATPGTKHRTKTNKNTKLREKKKQQQKLRKQQHGTHQEKQGEPR
jgi:hypothetical protein